jgi:hypothetical protein
LSLPLARPGYMPSGKSDQQQTRTGKCHVD